MEWPLRSGGVGRLPVIWPLRSGGVGRFVVVGPERRTGHCAAVRVWRAVRVCRLCVAVPAIENAAVGGAAMACNFIDWQGAGEAEEHVYRCAQGLSAGLQWILSQIHARHPNASPRRRLAADVGEVCEQVVVEGVRDVVRQVGDRALAGKACLAGKAQHGNHREAAVAQLLGAHHLLLLAVLRHAGEVEDGAACMPASRSTRHLSPLQPTLLLLLLTAPHGFRGRVEEGWQCGGRRKRAPAAGRVFR